MSRTSALHVAAGSNNLAVLDEVLRLPPVEQNAALTSRDGGNNTPLHIASYKGNLLFVQKILSSCSLAHYSVDLPNLVNDNGNSPLHLAVLGNHRPVVQALLAASPPSDFNLKDKQGYTPIHYACGEGYLDVAQVLHASGASFDVTNVEGLTPLMCCSQQGHAHVVRFIIDTHPRCVFFCNTAGDSALHYAGISEAGVPVAKLLILAGADIGKKNNDGLTCGDEARADGRSDFVAFLRAVQCGVDEALQRSRGDTSVFRTLVMEVFDQFDASAGKAVAPAAQRAPLLPDEGSKRLKFSSARATLRVKTTVEVLLEEQRQAAEARGAGGSAAAAAPLPKPKSRIMFSS